MYKILCEHLSGVIYAICSTRTRTRAHEATNAITVKCILQSPHLPNYIVSSTINALLIHKDFCVFNLAGISILSSLICGRYISGKVVEGIPDF